MPINEDSNEVTAPMTPTTHLRDATNNNAQAIHGNQMDSKEFLDNGKNVPGMPALLVGFEAVIHEALIVTSHNVQKSSVKHHTISLTYYSRISTKSQSKFYARN